MMTLRPLAEVLLDLIDLANAIISQPYAAFGRKAEVASINEEVIAWVVKPSDYRMIDDVEVMVVTALAHAADANLTGEQIQKWCDIAWHLLPFVQADAKRAVEAMERVPG